MYYIRNKILKNEKLLCKTNTVIYHGEQKCRMENIANGP